MAYFGHISYTKRLNNPVDLGTLQIKSAIEVNAIFINHQIDVRSIKIIQKGFSKEASSRSVSYNAKSLCPH